MCLRLINKVYKLVWGKPFFLVQIYSCFSPNVQLFKQIDIYDIKQKAMRHFIRVEMISEISTNNFVKFVQRYYRIIKYLCTLRQSNTIILIKLYESGLADCLVGYTNWVSNIKNYLTTTVS